MSCSNIQLDFVELAQHDAETLKEKFLAVLELYKIPLTRVFSLAVDNHSANDRLVQLLNESLAQSGSSWKIYPMYCAASACCPLSTPKFALLARP